MRTAAFEPLILLLAGWSAGISLYLTVGLLGVCGQFGWIHLPGGLETLSNPLIYGLAFVIFAVEFFADKIPVIDSAWDSIHTFIRPVGALFLGYLAGSEHGPVVQTAYALVTGTFAFNTHLAKATGRLAINTSPEPFSNIAASTAEQGAVLFMYWFFVKHPLIAGLVIAGLLVLAFFLIRLLWRFAKKIFTRAPAAKTGLILLFFLLFSAKAYAGNNCLADCMNASNCWGMGAPDDSYCRDTLVQCTTNCRNENRKSYGAIAFSKKDGGFGYSDGQENQSKAEKLAMKYCKQYGKKCESMVWFYNSCGAVASNGKKAGWGQDANQYAAQQKALKSCGKKDCEVKVSHCSF